MSIQLFGMLTWTQVIEDVSMEWKQPLENTVTFPKHPLMQKFENSDVPPELRRSKVVVEKRINFCEPDFTEEMLL